MPRAVFVFLLVVFTSSADIRVCPRADVYFQDDNVTVFRYNNTASSGHHVIVSESPCNGTEWLVFYKGEDIILSDYDGNACRYQRIPGRAGCSQEDCKCLLSVVAPLKRVRGQLRPRRQIFGGSSVPDICVPSNGGKCSPTSTDRTTTPRGSVRHTIRGSSMSERCVPSNGGKCSPTSAPRVIKPPRLE